MNPRSSAGHDVGRRAALASGVLVWFSYALIEELLYAVVPRWIEPSFVPFRLDFAMTLMATYFVAGVITGIVAAMLAGHGAHPTGIASAVVLGVALVAMISHGATKSILAASLLCGVALFVALVVSASSSFAKRLEFLVAPWVSPAIAVIPLWIGNDLMGACRIPARIAAFAVAVLVIAVLAYALRRKRLSILIVTSAAIVMPLAILVANRVSVRDATRTTPVQGRFVNIVLVTLDTVRADHLSLYGYERQTSPFLSQLAEKATLYRSAVAASNMTLSSLASIFTGRFGSEHHAHFDRDWPAGRPLSREAPTLAEILDGAGYETSAVVANYAFLGPGFGLDQGFGHLDARPAGTSRGSFRPYLIAALVRRGAATIYERWLNEAPTRSALAITDAAIRRIEAASTAGLPFFLFVNYMDAHSPYVPLPPFQNRFPGRRRVSTADVYMEAVRRLKHGEQPLPSAARDHLISQYDGAIASIDAELARLVGALERLRLYDRTLIVITSDHGEAFGDHGLVGHGVSLYRDQLHVPLIVKQPGQRSARVVDGPVSLCDLYYLIRHVAVGRPPLQPLQAIAESFPLVPTSDLPHFIRTGRALSRDGFTIIDHGGRVELYDDRRDPGNDRDLAGVPEYSAVLTQMRGELKKWIAERQPLWKSEVQPDEETIRRLRALGYLR